jgi:hypothetical protein
MACADDARAARVEKHPPKTIHLAQFETMKTALPAQIESLFARYPALCGFAVHGLEELPDNCPRSGGDGSELFVGDVGLSPALGREQFGEILQEILAVLAELLAEEPEASEVLRGRTFARALH